MFGKKKKKDDFIEIKEPVEEKADLEVSQEEVQPQQVAPQPVAQQLAPKPVQPKQEYIAQIVSGTLLGAGLYEYTIRTNKSVGEVGDIFEL